MENLQNNQILINGFLNSVNQRPGSIALDVNNCLYTYAEMHEASVNIANAIVKHQHSANNYTAILASNSLSAYTGILGALLIGKTYVPLNKKNPVLRTWDMLNRSGANTLVVGKECLEYFIELLPLLKSALTVVLPDTANTDDLQLKYPQHKFCFSNEQDLQKEEYSELTQNTNPIAYLLFTSGSTGIPKGVQVTNENVCAYLNYISDRFDFSATDKFSQTFPLAFDLSVHDMFLCWKVGACLCVPSEDASPALLSSFIKEKNITVWFSVPSLALLLMKMRLLKNNVFPSLRFSLFCGEALTEKVTFQWQQAALNSRILNLYGPTEATIAIACYEWKKSQELNFCINGIVPIGKVFNTQNFCIVDENKKQVNFGENGELLLSGTQISPGYLDDQENIKKQYMKLPGFGDNVWYKTGDLVREDEQNNLHFSGRIDSQVKIRGFRVELLEIDNAIRKIVNNDWVATVVEEHNDTLYSFICKNPSETEISESEILAYCRTVLPWYMIPGKLVFIEKMPLNNNGKIDRNKLKDLIKC
ncbi:MAG: amino acid adenylation domain-containing protein [Bacteroidetes bacterium]|nr:amino acid adenylation domain-containing protein [Bacteroidota bacterium]HET6243537.1 amino acid adenylation domain-containing protein [Bacteroidia bacterium]